MTACDLTTALLIKQPLTTHWQFCSSGAGAIGQPAELTDSMPWLAAPKLGSVAAMLSALGLWSLDSAESKRFDSEDWWFRLRFDALHGNLAQQILGFDGLATLTEVWLNGVSLLTSQSMFVQQQCAVGQLLKAEDNELVLVFRALDAFLTQRRPRPRWRVPMLEQQQLRWLRTTLLGRTPGWSPPVAIVGPWRDIWLGQTAPIDLEALRLVATLQDGEGVLTVNANLRSLIEPLLIQQATLHLSRQGKVYTAQFQPQGAQISGEIRIEAVECWWPHTHGEPALYAVELQLWMATGVKTFNLGQVGFRQVAFQNPHDNFAIAINGAPVFCRGACWTPLDPVSLVVADDQYRTAIEQVCAAGMNMLRLSGTLFYEADAFYQLCAEYGVMIWQDFMFASMDYPQEPAFLASVTVEAVQQLSSWQANPALTVLCGNSEVEQQASMWGAPRDAWQSPLFHQQLAALAQDYCPNTPYWPSSAHGGIFPHQNNCGTTSYYGVGAYLRPLADARHSKVAFATECLAFANVPEPNNILKIPNPLGVIKAHHPRWKERLPRDLSASWDFEDVRDHYLGVLFGVNPFSLRYADHERYWLLSRVVGGEVMAATFSEWRSSYALCSGGLVWFLRDLWPGAGWGVIDSDGQPKAAYYYLKRVLQPLSVAISDEGTNGLFAHISHESIDEQPINLVMTAYQNGQTLVAHSKQSVTLMPRSQHAISLLQGLDHFMDLGNAFRFGPPIADAIHVAVQNSAGTELAEAFYLPAGLQQLAIVDLGLQATAQIEANGDALVSIRCARLALAVYFEVAGFLPEDNYFHLCPGKVKTVKLKLIKARAIRVFGYIGAINAPALVCINLTSDPNGAST